MAEEIINIAVIECPDSTILDGILSRIRSRFTCYMEDRTGEYCCELEFVSGKTPSGRELEAIIAKYPAPGLYLQVISYELPGEYLEHHVLKDGVWTDKIRQRSKNKYNNN